MNNNKQWKVEVSDKIKIVSVISNPWYKGVDLILKTAQLLKRFTGLDFNGRSMECRIFVSMNINIR